MQRFPCLFAFRISELFYESLYPSRFHVKIKRMRVEAEVEKQWRICSKNCWETAMIVK